MRILAHHHPFTYIYSPNCFRALKVIKTPKTLKQRMLKWRTLVLVRIMMPLAMKQAPNSMEKVQYSLKWSWIQSSMTNCMKQSYNSTEKQTDEAAFWQVLATKLSQTWFLQARFKGIKKLSKAVPVAFTIYDKRSVNSTNLLNKSYDDLYSHIPIEQLALSSRSPPQKVKNNRQIVHVDNCRCSQASKAIDLVATSLLTN